MFARYIVHARRRQAWRRVGLLLAILLALASQVMAAQINAVRGLRTGTAGIEIELESTEEFPVRAEVTVLRIGDKEFTRSRHPEDGSLNRIIFVIDPTEFARLVNGDPMVVQYGRGDRGAMGPRWNFGQLNKALLGR